MMAVLQGADGGTPAIDTAVGTESSGPTAPVSGFDNYIPSYMPQF